MNKDNSIVAIYQAHTAAETAIKELQKSKLDMQKLSIVGKDSHTDEHVVGYYNTGERMQAWGKTGAFWGGLWGFMFGSAFFLFQALGRLQWQDPWLVGSWEMKNSYTALMVNILTFIYILYTSLNCVIARCKRLRVLFISLLSNC